MTSLMPWSVLPSAQRRKLRKSWPKAKAPEQFAREIIEIPVDDEMRDSFMPYALGYNEPRYPRRA